MMPLRNPFPAPSNTINMKIPHETEKPVKKVRSLFFLMVLHISLKLSKSNMILFFFDTFNQPVLYPDNPVCRLRYGGFVGNDHHGHPF